MSEKLMYVCVRTCKKTQKFIFALQKKEPKTIHLITSFFQQCLGNPFICTHVQLGPGFSKCLA